MSKTIEEIKEAFAKEKGFKNWDECLDLLVTNREVDEVAHRYAKSQAQELQEQNAELVEMLERCKYFMQNSIFTPHKNTALAITELLTKYQKP